MERPAQEKRQESVFTQMPAFANGILHLLNASVRDARVQPAQEWPDKPRGVLAGQDIGRPDENRGHPNEDGQPGLDLDGFWQHAREETSAAQAGQCKSIDFDYVLWQSESRVMKHFLSYQAILWLLSLSLRLHAADAATQQPALNSSQTIARLYSAGMGQLGTDPNGTVFKEIWNLPTTAQFRSETLDKAAGAFASGFQPKNGEGNCTALIRPLLDDLGHAELHVEVIEHPQNRVETTLALKLDDARARVWKSACEQLGSKWQPKKGSFKTAASGGWFAVRWGEAGEAPSGSGETLFKSIEQGHAPAKPGPAGQWFHLTADLARWAAGLKVFPAADLPKIDLAVSARKEYLRSQARLTFPEAFLPRIEQWEIPVETIRDPLISFTASQGLGRWLKAFPLLQQLGMTRFPNQLFFWGLSQTSFQIQAAAPVASSDKAFQEIIDQKLPRFNQVLSDFAIGSVQRPAEQTKLVWRGLPIVIPYLEPVRDHGKEYLHGGIFPVAPSTNPPPADLFRQVTAQTNLVYYDWEITQARLDEVRPLLQLASVVLNISPMSTNSTAHKWLDAIEPRLGNTVTEVTMSSPRELSLQRSSHIGFNGLELVTLANWLNGTNFPRANLDVRLRPAVQPGAPSQKR